MNRESFRKAMVEGNLMEKSYQIIKTFVLGFFNGNHRARLFKAIDLKFSMGTRKKLTQTTKVENNKIVFVTSRGSYNCNPKAIADEIIRRGLPWELVWCVRKENLKTPENFPKELQLVLRDSYDFFKALASARVWIDNSINLSYMYLPKKPEQVLIETWHGSFGLKRFETSSDEEWIRLAKGAGERTAYCVTNSTFESELLGGTFWGSSEMLEYGHPRNDILINPNHPKLVSTQRKVRQYFQIRKGVRVALYAPTYRDSTSLAPYGLDYEGVRDALKKRFGGEWVILARLHFMAKRMLARQKKKRPFPEFVIDATDYDDIQDILTITDVGITDYSSWICDYVLTGRPGFYFATDMDHFYSERGFYDPLEKTPFPLAEDNDELIANILNFNEADYHAKCKDYLRRKGAMEDGHAAERVVDKIEEIMRS